MESKPEPNLAATGSFTAAAGSEASTISLAPSGTKTPETAQASADATTDFSLPLGVYGEGGK